MWRAAGPLKSGCGFFANVVELDVVGDEGRRLSSKITSWGFFGIFLGFLSGIGLTIAGVGVPWNYIPFALGGLMFWAIIINFVIKPRVKDVPNVFRETVVPFVRLVGEDMAPGSPLEMALDLRGKILADKQVGGPKMGRSPKQGHSEFRDTWFSGRATLADGTVVGWQVTDDLTVRKFWKRNARGKSKLKTKYKMRSTIECVLRPKKARYELSGNDIAGVKVKSGEQRETMRLRELIKSKPLNFATGTGEPTLELQALVEQLTKGYARLQSSA